MVFGCTAGLIAVEVAVRLMGVSYPQPYVPDTQLGSRLQPGFEGWFTREGRAYVTVNSAGFRDREHTKNKPDGTFRIAVLGDSYAEAVQVPIEHTFWSVLERELGEAKPREARFGKVEVLNFGISGYGTAQELETLRHVALEYDPDLVLVAFLSGNDIRNNSKLLEPVKVRPFYELMGDELVLDTSFRQHPDFLKAQSGSTRFKVSCINSSRILQMLADFKNRSADHSDQPEQGLNAEIYSEPTDSAWQAAWTLTNRLLTTMSEVCETQGVKFAVVTLTNAAQVHPDPGERERLARQLKSADLFYPEKRIAELGEGHGFIVITLAQHMAQRATETKTFYHGFANTRLGSGHWNASGHQIAGERMAAELLKSGALENNVP